MKIAIAGSGITGVFLAKLLFEKGHIVTVFEIEKCIGGLCKTDVANGFLYDVYGAHVFHTNNLIVWDLVSKYFNLNSYVHKKGVIINNIAIPFFFPKNNVSVDETNFKTASISLFGEKVYKLVIENYTRKMWDVDPSKLDAKLAKRLMFEEIQFLGEKQGVAKNGYSLCFNEMLKGIEVCFNKEVSGKFDLIIHTGSLDKLFNFCYGKLPYRGLEFTTLIEESWENKEWGSINLPQDPVFIRKCNFKTIYQDDGQNRIQYQKPSNVMSMYPKITIESINLYNKYLTLAVNRCLPAGRLGLFKYIDMDESVELALFITDHIEWYRVASNDERFVFISKIVKNKF